MASLLQLRMKLSAAVAIVVVASSLAPAFAARALQADTSTLVTTPSPAETQRPSLVFGTAGPSPWPSIFGSGLPTCTGSECVECPTDTGYTFTLTTSDGKICTKTYPVEQADGKLPGKIF
jgi:hypothetical protein